MLGSHQRSACIDEGLLLDKMSQKKADNPRLLHVAFPTQPENFSNMIDI
jgi:hypothetical protein